MKTPAAKRSHATSNAGHSASAVHVPMGINSRKQLENVRSIIQPKLTVGAPNDSYEQEADRVADRVIADHSVGSVSKVSSGLAGRETANTHPVNPLQQQAEENEQEQEQPKQEEIQRRLVQLQSAAAEDDEEQNAQARLLRRQPEEGEEASVQAKAEAGQEGKQLKYVVNADAPEQEPKEEVQAKADVHQQDEAQLQGKQASPPSGQETSVASMLNSSKGGGSPLPANVRGEMESQFSADFSGVRIHTSGNAVAMSSQIHAQAFAQGGDIYFNEGKFDPGSSAGRHLLAHELTHTIQQGASPQRGGNPAPVQRKVDERIQRNWLGDAWDAVSDAASSAVNFVAEQLDAALNYAKGLFTDFVQGIPGYRLLSVVIGQDPVTGRTVEQNGINFIEAGLDVIPFGDSFRRKLEQTGKLQVAAAWLDERMKSLDGISLSAILANLGEFWRSLSITDLGDIPGVLGRAANIIRAPIARVVTFCGDVASYFLKLIKDYLLGELSDFIGRQAQARGFPLLTVILGKNPITDEEVPRNGMNLIRGFMLLASDGQEQLRQMEESGSLQRAAAWIDTSVANLGLAWEGIKNAFTESWALVTIENLVTNLPGTFLEIVGKFVAPVTIILNFLLEVGRMILQFIKEALLSRLSAHARETRGYTLLTVILGQDPFTGNPVERNAENLIHGFMALMEGGEEQFQEMKQSGAIDNMTARIEQAVATLNFTWDYITGLFLSAWNSFSLQDLAAPLSAFMRIVGLFADPLLRLFAFVVEVVKIAIEVALQLMQFPFALINNIIAKATQAFNDIKRDPIGFLKNLLRAVKTGFTQFFDRIGTHLLNGVTAWLFKELGDAGITPPSDLSLRSILGLVFQVLGISMDKIFEKLAAKIGPERVARIRAMGERLAGAWAFISDVMERGPIAIWEYVQEKLNNLWNMVLEAVSNWIVTQVVNRIVARLLSMLDPTGIMAVVNGFIAFFRAVQSFIAYLREMLEIVNSFVEGVAEIAAGNVTNAANYLEGALARAMPVAIGFLANQVGLSGLGRRIGEMIGRVQEKVDEGIDWLIDRAMSAGSALLNMGRAAVGAVRGWWQNRLGLRMKDNHDHELFFQGSGNSTNLLIASNNPKPIIEFINDLKRAHNLTDSQVEPALAKARQINEEKVSNRTDEEKARIINGYLNELKNLLAAINIPETSAELPKVNTYKELTGKVAHYNPHHVPPKGLMRWVYRVLVDVPEPILDHPNFSDWKTSKQEAETEMATGDNLTSILIHENTHIRRTDNAAQDAYRAHHGSAVRDVIEEVMREDHIRRTTSPRVDSLSRADQLSLLEDVLEERGLSTSLATESNIRTYKSSMQAALTAGGGRASTQFYMTELDQHAQRNRLGEIVRGGTVDGNLREYKRDVEEGVKATFGVASQQSLLAVRTALEGRRGEGMDGTATTQAVALEQLPPHGRTTWSRFIARFMRI